MLNTPTENTKNPLKAYLKTFGCQMNAYDSQRIEDILLANGYELATDPKDTDLVLLNTCNIREKASEKVYSEIGKILKTHMNGNKERPKIGVIGCVAQAEGTEIIHRQPAVSFVLGPQSYHHLPNHLKTENLDLQTTVSSDFSISQKFNSLPQIQTKRVLRNGSSAFVTIQEGCDKFCTFCVVPYTRGPEASRPVEDIIDEINILSENGVSEITLLGQNVNAYHGKSQNNSPFNLSQLIVSIENRTRISRIRYTTSHPIDMDEELIQLHGNSNKLMPYLHLPIQSGSDKILKAMNRRHKVEDYLNIITKLHSLNKRIALSSDFIVGFPGETPEDHEFTLKLLEKVQFSSSYSFAYSPRPGTPAEILENQIPTDIKKQRLHKIQAILKSQMLSFNENTIGETFDVLIEKRGKKPQQYVGKSPYLQAVHVESDSNIIGKIVSVQVCSLTQHGLIAKLI